MSLPTDDSASRASTSRHVEIERKFDVADSTSTPSFAGQGQIAHAVRKPAEVLRATYFDTPEHDLAANRITLRRRTGGSDAGWHLKIPGSASARTEVRTKLGETSSDNVPAVLRELVVEIVRDKLLVIVARITNVRTVDVLYGTDGTAIAEFCDDHVTGSAALDGSEYRWREWEIELTEDTAQGRAGEQLLEELGALLCDAGAVPAQHASKLAKVLGSLR